jgi:hypothetical protein
LRASQALALELCQHLNDQGGEAECRNNIGDVLLASAPAQAQASYEHALQISRTIKQPLEEARATPA